MGKLSLVSKKILANFQDDVLLYINILQKDG